MAKRVANRAHIDNSTAVADGASALQAVQAVLGRYFLDAPADQRQRWAESMCFTFGNIDYETLTDATEDGKRIVFNAKRWFEAAFGGHDPAARTLSILARIEELSTELHSLLSGPDRKWLWAEFKIGVGLSRTLFDPPNVSTETHEGLYRLENAIEAARLIRSCATERLRINRPKRGRPHANKEESVAREAIQIWRSQGASIEIGRGKKGTLSRFLEEIFIALGVPQQNALRKAQHAAKKAITGPFSLKPEPMAKAAVAKKRV